MIACRIYTWYVQVWNFKFKFWNLGASNRVSMRFCFLFFRRLVYHPSSISAICTAVTRIMEPIFIPCWCFFWYYICIYQVMYYYYVRTTMCILDHFIRSLVLGRHRHERPMKLSECFSTNRGESISWLLTFFPNELEKLSYMWCLYPWHYICYIYISCRRGSRPHAP